MNTANNSKIAIIDDDEDYRFLCGEALKILGYETISFSRGIDALNSFVTIESMPAIVLVDMIMPDISGIDFVKKLRSTPNGEKIKIFVVSAKNDLEDLAQQIQVDGILQKPYQLEDMQKLIQKALTT